MFVSYFPWIFSILLVNRGPWTSHLVLIIYLFMLSVRLASPRSSILSFIICRSPVCRVVYVLMCPSFILIQPFAWFFSSNHLKVWKREQESQDWSYSSFNLDLIRHFLVIPKNAFFIIIDIGRFSHVAKFSWVKRWNALLYLKKNSKDLVPVPLPLIFLLIFIYVYESFF